MPSFKHSKLTRFFLGLGVPTPTLTDISTYCSSVTLTRDLDLIDITTFGFTSTQYMAGYADAKLSVEGNWDPTIHAALAELADGFEANDLDSTPFEYGPEGSDSGDQKQSGDCVVTSYEPSSEGKDQVKWSLDLQVTGPVVTGTF